MKSLRSLARQIGQWRHVYYPLRQQDKSRPLPPTQRQLHQIFALQWRHLHPQRLMAIGLRPNPLRRKSASGAPAWVILAVAVVSLTSAIGHDYYNEPQLNVGTIAPQTFRAPDRARVEDSKTTADNRTAARTGAVPALTIDQAVNQEIYQSLQRYLDQGSQLRQQAGAFPFVDPMTLSIGTQQYLRQVEEREWRSVLAAVSNAAAPPPASTSVTQQLAILELQTDRDRVSAEDFSMLKEAIVRARQRYAASSSTLTRSTNDPSSTLRGIYDTALLALTDADWMATQTSVRAALERILTQGIAPGLPDSLLENAARSQVLEVPPAGQPIAVALLTAVMKPNLMQDAEQTRLRAEQAAQAVEPEIVEIQRGEVIVQTGKKITQPNFVLLDHFGLSRRATNWIGLLGLAGLIGGAIGLYLWIERCFHPGLRWSDHVLVLLLTLSVPLMMALGLPTHSLPAIGLLVGSFYGSALGIAVVCLLSWVLPFGIQVSWSALIASTIASLVGAGLARRLRSREELALLGGAVGITQGVLYLLLSLILNTPTSPVWYGVLAAAALQGLMGIAWSVVAIGISPYLEHLFDLITPTRLAELSNPNRPLLKRLAANTPGTFQHTLFVATLAEAAARVLGCNVELVRAGTLYHDIGKMHDPLGFIENQMGGVNKHDVIADPWKSAEIIKKHVTEGLVMARKSRLPKAIQSFIPEHQGTMPIAYFHHQAKQIAQENSAVVVNDVDFCYDGPIPQSRETGIVMLADSCEAALRSLKDATPEDALAMVNRILRARWQDNQMTDSGLTRSEMSQIADVFVRVWQQFNHPRIPYPKAIAPRL